MRNIGCIVVTLFALCWPSLASASPPAVCFNTLEELRQVHKQEHAWWTKSTTNIDMKCWHVHKKNYTRLHQPSGKTFIPTPKIRTNKVTPEEGARLRDYLLPYKGD